MNEQHAASEATDHPKQFRIIVNASQETVTTRELTYTQVVNLAFNNSPPSGPYVVITVDYRRGDDQKPEGTLLPGQTVKIKDGMVFNVTATDKS